VKRPSWPYCRSKADSELVARKFQALGAPVVSIMPAGLWGPHDPHLGEGVTLAANVLRHRYPIVMAGGMHIADVRDVAAVLAAVMQPGRGPRGYLVTGHYVTMPGIIGTLGDLSGRRIRFVTLPAGFLAAFGRAADLVQRRLRTRLPWSAESIWIVNCDARCDDSKTRDELQVEPRPLRETFAATVRWLAGAGHLTHARRAASPYCSSGLSCGYRRLTLIRGAADGAAAASAPSHYLGYRCHLRPSRPAASAAPLMGA
jgi:dihydroflavonol-4-reductase